MNLFDLILFLLLIGSLIRGYQRGLVLQATSLIGLFIGIWAAYQFTDELAPMMSEVLPLPESVSSGWLALLPINKLFYSSITFLVLLFGSKFLWSIAAALMNQVANLPIISAFNRTGGVLFGLLQALLILVILVHVLQLLPWTTGKEAITNSLLSQLLLAVTPDLKEGLLELFRG